MATVSENEASAAMDVVDDEQASSSVHVATTSHVQTPSHIATKQTTSGPSEPETAPVVAVQHNETTQHKEDEEEAASATASQAARASNSHAAFSIPIPAAPALLSTNGLTTGDKDDTAPQAATKTKVASPSVLHLLVLCVVDDCLCRGSQERRITVH